MRKLHGDWRDLFYCFGLAFLSPRKLFLALMGCVTSVIGVYFFSLVLVGMLHVNGEDASSLLESLGRVFGYRDVDEFLRLGGLIVAMLDLLHDSFGCLGWFWYAVFLSPWLWMVWCHYGGMISRIAALDIARNLAADSHDVIAYVRAKYRAYFYPPIALFAMLFACLLVANLPLLLTQLPGVPGAVCTWLAALWIPVQLILSLFALALGLGLVFGWVFMIPAISIEGTDHFEALSRSYSYTLQTPIRYALLMAVLLGFGAVSWLLVMAFGSAACWLSNLGMKLAFQADVFAYVQSLLNWQTVEGMSLRYTVLAWSAIVWMTFLMLTLASYGMSYFFTACTMLYYLQRKYIDNIPYEHVYLEPTAPAIVMQKPEAQPAGNTTAN